MVEEKAKEKKMSLMLTLWNNPQLAYFNFYFFVNGEEAPDSFYIVLMVINVQNLYPITCIKSMNLIFVVCIS